MLASVLPAFGDLGALVDTSLSLGPDGNLQVVHFLPLSRLRFQANALWKLSHCLILKSRLGRTPMKTPIFPVVVHHLVCGWSARRLLVHVPLLGNKMCFLKQDIEQGRKVNPKQSWSLRCRARFRC
mmetsp:Transcript_23747/g.62459  ORF Transcript_23747/g.62459 Transcript_23747/m.62459 type:complete len:126 (-) Transcript_23747:1035-1412(-)